MAGSGVKEKLFIEAFPLIGDNPSGIGKLLYSLIDALGDDNDFLARYDIILITSFRKRKNIEKWNFSPAKVQIKVLPLPLKVINILDRLHLMLPIDWLLGRGIYLFPNYRRLPLARSRSLTYVHDISYHLFPDTVQPANRSFLERSVPEAVRKSDLVITLSEQSKRELITLFPSYADKVSVVPCGVDQHKYARPSNKVIDEYLTSIGVERDNYIAFVGNIEPRKNIDYMIDVYVNLVDSGDVKKSTKMLLIGGDGWNNTGTIKKISDITQQGYQVVRPDRRVPDDALPSVYSGAILTLLLSLHEGFGMTPLEALATGGKVVVSDIPVLHEVGGGAVWYAPLDNENAAVDVLRKVISTHVNSGEIQKKLDEYSWESAERKFVSLVDTLADFDYNDKNNL